MSSINLKSYYLDTSNQNQLKNYSLNLYNVRIINSTTINNIRHNIKIYNF